MHWRIRVVRIGSHDEFDFSDALRRITALLLVVVIFIESHGIAIAAMDPILAPVSTPISPDPAICKIAPRSHEDIESLWADESATPTSPEPATPIPVPTFEYQPNAEPFVAGTTVRDVLSTIEEMAACYNAGDPGRVLALFTRSAASQELHRRFYDSAELFHSLAVRPQPIDQWVTIDVTVAYSASPGSDRIVVAFHIMDPQCASDTSGATPVLGFVRWEEGRFRWDAASPFCDLFGR